MNAAERRADMRSTFPPSSKPVVSSAGKTYPVLDMNKTCVCFAVPASFPLHVGDHFTGTLGYRGGSRGAVAGYIVRLNRKCAVLRFETAPKPDLSGT